MKRLLALLVLLLPLQAWAEDTAVAGDCQTLYAAGDPALYTFVATREAVDYGPLDGVPIRSIGYTVLPVFNENDPEENNRLYRLLNVLHVDTKAETLRKQMIIHPGEALDVAKLAENERLLRENDYLIDAMILPRAICADGVDLLVVVRDIWTLSPSASASRSGGDNSSGAGISERNLLGTGQQLSLGYFQDADRSGRGISYRNRQMFSNHSILRLDYYDNSDGYERGASLEKPFYELDSNWSAGAWFNELRLTETIEENDVVINRYDREERSGEVFVGWSPGRQKDRVHRIRLGLADSQERFFAADYPPSAPPDDKRLRYPWISWELTEDRYWTTSNISRSHRQEDILLGSTVTARVGYASTDFDSTENSTLATLYGGYTAGLGDHHLMRLSAYIDGRYDRDNSEIRSTYHGGKAEYFNFIDRLNRWYARASFDIGRNVLESEELTLGGNDNLRGYPSNVQRGNRRWVVSVERRRFTDIHLFNLAYLGGAAYVDAGRVWDSTAPDNGDGVPTLANAGLGLRLSPSKFRIDKVLHIDVAFPLRERDQVDDYQLIVSGRVDF